VQGLRLRGTERKLNLNEAVEAFYIASQMHWRQYRGGFGWVVQRRVGRVLRRTGDVDWLRRARLRESLQPSTSRDAANARATPQGRVSRWDSTVASAYCANCAADKGGFGRAAAQGEERYDGLMGYLRFKRATKEDDGVELGAKKAADAATA
jgi:hypothetical protein